MFYYFLSRLHLDRAQSLGRHLEARGRLSDGLLSQRDSELLDVFEGLLELRIRAHRLILDTRLVQELELIGTGPFRLLLCQRRILQHPRVIH